MTYRRAIRTKPGFISYYIYSENILADVVYGKKDYLLIGSEGQWWKKYKGKVVNGQPLLVKIHNKRHLAFKSIIVKWEKIDDPLDSVAGLLGDYIKITLKNVYATSYTRYYIREHANNTTKTKKTRDEAVILKSKIRNAFK